MKNICGAAIGLRALSFAPSRRRIAMRPSDTLRARLSWIRNSASPMTVWERSEEHTSELQSQSNLVCRLLLEKKKKITTLSVALQNAMKRYDNVVVRWNLTGRGSSQMMVCRV